MRYLQIFINHSGLIMEREQDLHGIWVYDIHVENGYYLQIPMICL